jgi:hypothetical protein
MQIIQKVHIHMPPYSIRIKDAKKYLEAEKLTHKAVEIT